MFVDDSLKVTNKNLLNCCNYEIRNTLIIRTTFLGYIGLKKKLTFTNCPKEKTELIITYAKTFLYSLTLHVIMNSSSWYDTINLGWSIVYFQGNG